MNIQEAVYREETARWYMVGQEFKTAGVVALNYNDAFELLYGSRPFIAPPVRAPRRQVILP